MPEPSAEKDAVRIDTSRPELFNNEPQVWATVVLDDGSEVRMRSLGDRVEVRAWDHSETCNPPTLSVKRIGHHVIDVRVISTEGQS